MGGRTLRPAATDRAALYASARVRKATDDSGLVAETAGSSGRSGRGGGGGESSGRCAMRCPQSVQRRFPPHGGSPARVVGYARCRATCTCGGVCVVVGFAGGVPAVVCAVPRLSRPGASVCASVLPAASASDASQEGADGDFHLVWDGWLLDTLSSWQRQPEEAYAIVDDGSAEEAPSEHAAMTSLLGAPRLRHAAADETQQRAQAASEQPASDPSSDDAGNPTSGGPGLPPRKRPRPEPAAPGANGRVHQYGPAPSVASYLQQQNGLLSVAITADAQ